MANQILPRDDHSSRTIIFRTEQDSYRNRVYLQEASLLGVRRLDFPSSRDLSGCCFKRSMWIVKYAKTAVLAEYKGWASMALRALGYHACLPSTWLSRNAPQSGLVVNVSDPCHPTHPVPFPPRGFSRIALHILSQLKEIQIYYHE
jgi:hypothetical protein